MKPARSTPRRLALLAILALPLTGLAADGLPRPAGLEPEIGFWRQIFADVSTSQFLVHDNRYLDIVYEKVDIPAGASDASRQRAMEAAKARYTAILSRLATGDRKGLDADERRVLALWQDRSDPASLRSAAERVRVQQGLSDRFLEGLVRSGRWREHILMSLERANVPAALVALPHVESSYNPEARSFVGAAGLWQFTAGTGRQFLRIDSVVDERRDPFRSSEAAARYLRANYNSLNSWPLAITAYNHGAGGMRRAVREMGTDNIETIIRSYSGPAFGFASRNFYVSFLAAEEVDRNAERHFGPVRLDDPDPGWVIEMPAYVGASSLAAVLQVPTETLQAANPALLPPVWAGKKYVPRGLNVRLPGHVNPDDARARLASIPATDRKSAQVADPVSGTHKVRRGETLSGIAARYGTTPARLASLNGLSKANLIREGQVLKLGDGAQAQARSGAGTQGGKATTQTGTYVVRPGDNLAGIAKRTGVPQSRLMALNAIDNPHRIFPGQRLRLSAPASGG